MSTPDRGARAEWRASWPVVLAATCGMAVASVNTYGNGVFVQPLQDAFGWSRAQIYTGHAISAAISVVLTPFMGVVIDRFGPRRIGIIGVILLCSLTACLGLTGPDIRTWYLVWVGLAFSAVFFQPTVWTSAIAGLFTSGRGFALAVTLSGGGICSFLTPMLAEWLVARYGWRLGFAGLGAVWALIVWPPIFLFFRGARDRERAQKVRPPAPERGSAWAIVRSEIFTSRFIRLAMATLLVALVVVSYAASFFPILTANGLARGETARLLSVLGISSICGRLGIGWLLDRLDGRILAACAVSLPAITSALLIAYPHSSEAALVAVLFAGLALGAELDLVAYLTSRYFSIAHYGLLYGTMVSFVMLAGGTGPLAVNAVFDAWGVYTPALWAAIPMSLTSALLFLTLGPYDRSRAH